MRTTKKDFQMFKKECEVWIERFGLLDWDVHFFHDDLPEGMYAGTSGWYKPKNAEISLNTNVSKDYYSPKCIKETAFHEVCELLLMELRIIAQTRYIQEEDIDHACHGIIQRLLNGVYRHG
jgi:hypothetical protein